MTRADWPELGCYPKPFYVVHLVPAGRILALCGRWPGSRRFDPGRGTFCQHTGRLTLTAEQPEGFTACADCLTAQDAGQLATIDPDLTDRNALSTKDHPVSPADSAAQLTNETERNPHMHTTPTWYPATCPTWCAGRHASLLALADDDAPDAEELITHARDLLNSEISGGLMVSLGLDQLHPDSDGNEQHNHDAQVLKRPAAGCPACDADQPHVYVWLPDHHDAQGITPAQLRGWASLLNLAADRATELLTEDGHR